MRPPTATIQNLLLPNRIPRRALLAPLPLRPDSPPPHHIPPPNLILQHLFPTPRRNRPWLPLARPSADLPARSRVPYARRGDGTAHGDARV